eukprot:2469882-Pyramimonas_sp.AAC.1
MRVHARHQPGDDALGRPRDGHGADQLRTGPRARPLPLPGHQGQRHRLPGATGCTQTRAPHGHKAL